MIVLCIKTDTDQASVLLHRDNSTVAEDTWQSGRQLASTLLKHIDTLLLSCVLRTNDLEALVVFQGPGSFTGLRIGVTVANTLAYSLNIPIIGTRGEHWMRDGIETLKSGNNDQLVLPEYGGEVHITM